MLNKSNIAVLIPVYTNRFSYRELVSIGRCADVLSDYPLFFVAPHGLDLSEWKGKGFSFEYFDERYFHDIEGYNTLMLSAEFYMRFQTFHYILIHQTDAYVFRDELLEWATKGYDYIGAPWLLKPKYRHYPYKLLLHIKKGIAHMKGEIHHESHVGDKVGNGGLSLRKTVSHIRSLQENEMTVKVYIDRCGNNKEFNEDVYWALENKTFRYPTWQEALHFSIDERPQWAMNELNGQLPFGCHGWNKPFAERFWARYIKQDI